MNNDLEAIFSQIRQRLIEQSSAPAQRAMEEIKISGVKTDPLQYIPQQAQMQSLGGLTGMPVPGMGPQSYNPLFKQDFVKEPSVKDLGAMMGK